MERAIKKYGGRVDLSVFECMLTESQLTKLQTEIEVALDSKTGQVVYYRLGLDCFAAIVYQPQRKRKELIASCNALIFRVCASLSIRTRIKTVFIS